MPGPWVDSGCGGPRARWLEDGHIEVEGIGIPTRPLPDGVNQWETEIKTSAAKHSLFAHFIAGFMALESGGKQFSRGGSGECGLMQILPSTASSMAGRIVTCDELLNDPALNIELGTTYIEYQMNAYDSNPIKVTAAYNAGSARCSNCQSCACNQWGLVAACSNGQQVDYPLIVMGFANDAWNGVFNPSSAPNAKLPGSTTPAASPAGISPLAIAAGIGIAAAIYYGSKRS